MTATPALNDDLVRLETRCRIKAAVLSTRGDANTLHDITQAADYLNEAASALEAQSKEIEALRAALSNGDSVHLNMLRGTIAKPTVEQIAHIYPEIAGWRDALTRLVNPAPGVKALPAWVYGIVNAALRARTALKGA